MTFVSILRFFFNTGRPRLSPIAFCYASLLVTFRSLVIFAETPAVDLRNLQPALEMIRSKHQLPAIGAALVTTEGLSTLGTTGVRKRGELSQVTDDDLWHLGSCSKAITATMIARLVERGKLKWEQTLGDTFPELVGNMSPAIKSITLSNLLSHRSGLNANFQLRKYLNETDMIAARKRTLVEAMNTPLNSAPGTKFLYSNWGYTIAGTMAERVSGKTWEDLMKIEVFEPLKMKSAGFGGIGTIGKIDQPWPHTENGKPTLMNGPKVDNVPTMGPAGTIHMTLEDWGKFISEHLRGAKGKSDYLQKESFEKLHKPTDGDYAFGWRSMERGWAGGKAIFHNGDNTMNFAVVWAAPEKGFAVLAVLNQSSTHQAADDTVSAIIQAYGLEMIDK